MMQWAAFRAAAGFFSFRGAGLELGTPQERTPTQAEARLDERASAGKPHTATHGLSRGGRPPVEMVTPLPQTPAWQKPGRAGISYLDGQARARNALSKKPPLYTYRGAGGFMPSKLGPGTPARGGASLPRSTAWIAIPCIESYKMVKKGRRNLTQQRFRDGARVWKPSAAPKPWLREIPTALDGHTGARKREPSPRACPRPAGSGAWKRRASRQAGACNGSSWRRPKLLLRATRPPAPLSRWWRRCTTGGHGSRWRWGA